MCIEPKIPYCSVSAACFDSTTSQVLTSIAVVVATICSMRLSIKANRNQIIIKRSGRGLALVKEASLFYEYD